LSLENTGTAMASPGWIEMAFQTGLIISKVSMNYILLDELGMIGGPDWSSMSVPLSVCKSNYEAMRGHKMNNMQPNPKR